MKVCCVVEREFGNGCAARVVAEKLQRLVLDGGSFNVIEAGVFAGEGLIESIHPGEKRLISYAADLAMQVVMKSENTPEVVTRLHVTRGKFNSHGARAHENYLHDSE